MLTPEQIEARLDGVTGSDAAVIAGLSKRMTARELFHVKRRELPSPEADPESAWLGQQVEPLLGRRYQRETGRRPYRRPETLHHPDLPWMMAHVDFEVRAARPPRGLECKFRVRQDSDEWGPSGSEYVPDDVYLQVQHYLAVTGHELWDVIAWLGAVDFRIYTVAAAPDIADRLIALESGFHRAVLEGEPPDLALDHPTTLDLLHRLYPGTDGRVLHVGEQVPEDAEHWHSVYQDAKARERQYQQTARLARAHLEAEMGTAAVLMLPDGGRYVRRRMVRRAHEVAASEYLSFNYSPPAKEVDL